MKFALTTLILSLLIFGCNKPTNEDNVKNRKMKIVYLKKANDDVISHCKCDDGRITFPPQISCPWCGCGWLFTCITCRKAFTFAEAVELETTWEELAKEDIKNKWKKDASKEDIKLWTEAMQEILTDIKLGQKYVIIDGVVLHVDTENIEYDGWEAHHEFARLPQVLALEDKEVLKKQLSNKEYWLKNALPEEK